MLSNISKNWLGLETWRDINFVSLSHIHSFSSEIIIKTIISTLMQQTRISLHTTPPEETKTNNSTINLNMDETSNTNPVVVVECPSFYSAASQSTNGWSNGRKGNDMENM